MGEGLALTHHTLITVNAPLPACGLGAQPLAKLHLLVAPDVTKAAGFRRLQEYILRDC